MPTSRDASDRSVFAIGWFGQGNLGDEAMLDGLLALLRRAGGPIKATVTSGEPAETRTTHGTLAIRLEPWERFGFRNLDVVRASLGARLVTLGGGDLIREQSDGTVPALNWLRRLRVPLRLGRPTAVVGISVGDLVTPAVIDEVARTLRRVTFVAARDHASAVRLSELVGRPVLQIGDLALETADELARPRQPDRGGPRIGLAIRDIIGRGPTAPRASSEHLRVELAAALDAVVDDAAATVELIPFRTRGPGWQRDDDARAGEALAALARHGSRWIHHRRPRDVSAFADIAGRLDLILSVRLHGAVLGAAAGIPVVGIAYDAKVSGFMDDIGLPDQGLPVDASAGEIRDAVLRSLADDGLSARVAAGVGAARARTREIEPELRRLLRSSPA